MITLQQLQYFRELANNGHLTNTAKKLFITQTTLSGSIIKLEKQLGVRLFDRTGRSLRLNEIGQGYLAYVNQALLALENGQSFIEDRQEQGARSISLSIINATIWTPLIQSFQMNFQNHTVHLSHCTPDQLRNMLLDMKVDFVIAGIDDLPLSDLEFHIFHEQQIYLYVPKEHPFANRASLSLQDIQHESFISLPTSQPFRRFCDNMFKKAGLSYKTVLECDYLMGRRLIEAGLGVNLTTDITKVWYANFHDSNKFIPLSEDVPRRPMAIIWNPQRYLGLAARNFRDYVISSQHPVSISSST